MSLRDQLKSCNSSSGVRSSEAASETGENSSGVSQSGRENNKLNICEKSMSAIATSCGCVGTDDNM